RPCSRSAPRCPADRAKAERKRGSNMPRTFTYGLKLMAVSALTIAVVFARADMAFAYSGSVVASYAANDGGKDKAKGDKGKEAAKADVQAKTDVKAESKTSEKSGSKGSEKTEQSGSGESGETGESGGTGGTGNGGGSSQNGNNGTVKVINDSGDSTNDQDEDSHVCLFHLYGFHFDANQSGTWKIVSWPPTGNGATVATGAWGPASAGTGEWHTSPSMSLPSGHYKLNLETGMGDGKHKVFWVDCGT